MVRSHVFRPDHITASLHIELRQAGDGRDEPGVPPPSGLLYRLDVEGLGRDLRALLSPCLTGYSLQLRRYGRTLLDQQWNAARTPVDGDVDWTSNVQMHVASVSKLITAMALTKVLHSRSISPDRRICRGCRGTCNKGPFVDQLTFRAPADPHIGAGPARRGGQSCGFLFMKEQMALGTVGAHWRQEHERIRPRRILIHHHRPCCSCSNLCIPRAATDVYWYLTTTSATTPAM